MKTLGVIGGIGPESTIEYYRHLIAAYRALKAEDGGVRLDRRARLDTRLLPSRMEGRKPVHG